MKGTGLTAKLLWFGAGVLVLLTFALLWPTRTAMRAQVVEDLQNQLAAIAATAALHINGDRHAAGVSALLDSAAQGGTMDPTQNEDFRAVQGMLRVVRDANGLGVTSQGVPTDEYLYTFAVDMDAGLELDNKQTLRFGVMTHADDALFVGEPYELHEHQARALETGRVAASNIYTDAFGDWISAAAPIRDAQGRIVGLLEVTQPSYVYFGRYFRLIWFQTCVALLTLVGAALLGYLLLRRTVLWPIRQVRRGLEALGRRDFTHRVDIQTGDEFQELGDTLNSLAGQLNAAKVVQAGFVPQSVPSGDGYAVALLSEPCDATGGDYVDAFRLDDGRIAVLIADVTGHGLGPSLVMASCRAALRALANTDLSPSALVAKLEQLLEADLTDGKFITMLYGVLDHDGTFTYCNAGHAPALIRQCGKAGALPPHRPPLGVIIPPVEGEAGEARVALCDGDRILLTSDGVNEAMNPASEQLGTAPMCAILEDVKLDAKGVVDRLCETVRDHRGGRRADDDVAILCVDRPAWASGPSATHAEV
ncbi:MAG: SpoIIE family protein phosphatase [Planctomycetota bacterium]